MRRTIRTRERLGLRGDRETCATWWVESGMLDIRASQFLALSYNVVPLPPSPLLPARKILKSMIYGRSVSAKYS